MQKTFEPHTPFLPSTHQLTYFQE